MRNVSTAYKQMLYQNKRKYENTLLITLANNTQLTVTNEHIMDSGFDIDDAVGEDGSFSALGSTIINSCDVTLYNNDEIYSDYDFKNAKVVVKTNLVGADSSDELQLGEYTVDEPTYGESTITLKLLDNMCQFDRDYASYNIYTSSTTIYDVVLDACTKCGVLYDSSLTNMPNKNFIVPSAPKDDTTYREVIGWCATIAGCFARCNSEGKLEFSWFNTDAFATEQANNTDGGIFDSASPYATGDNVNGGTFNPWNDPTSVDGGAFTENTGIHYIQTLNSQNIAVDDVVITGIQVTYDVETDGSNTSETQLRGTDDYVIEIKDNPFITADNYTSVLNFLAPQLIGLQFRPCNVLHPSDPTIEAGDVAYVWDTKGAQHNVLITRVSFNPTAPQEIVCGAESVGKNSSSRMSAITKALIKSQRQLNREKTLREQLEEDFQEQIVNGKGLYFTRVATGSSEITYGHDKPLLADSKVVLKLSTAGIAMTGNYTGSDATTTWYGATFDGTWLANIISTMNLFFDYAHGGTLSLGGNNNTNGILNVYDANNSLIGHIDSNGMSIQGNFIAMDGNNTVFGGIGIVDWLQYYQVEGVVKWLTKYGFAIKYLNSSNNILTQYAIFPDNTNVEEQIYTQNYWKKMIDFGTGAIDKSASANNYAFYMLSTGTLILRDDGLAFNASNYPGNNALYLNNLTVTGIANIYGGLGVAQGASVSFNGTSTINALTAKSANIDSSTVQNSTVKNANITSEVVSATAHRFYVTNGYNTAQQTYLIDIHIPGSGTRKIQLGNPASSTAEEQRTPALSLTGQSKLIGTSSSLKYNDTSIQMSSSSSIRYKHNIKQLSADRDAHKLLELPIVEFEWNDDHNLQYADMKGKVIPGIIAEDVAKIYPSAVIHDQETGEIESWDERRIIPGMLALIQEQDKKIKDQEAEIEDLKSRLEKLECAIMNIKR